MENKANSLVKKFVVAGATLAGLIGFTLGISGCEESQLYLPASRHPQISNILYTQKKLDKIISPDAVSCGPSIIYAVK